MPQNILDALVRFFCQHQDWIEFIWHGGEPLLAGIDFYEEALNYQSTWEEAGKMIRNVIQTNGTLVSKEWVSFFAENAFSVGVSLDGLSADHDALRTYGDGRGSFQDVMKGIERLREAGLFTGVICCVSSANVQHPVQLLDFLVGNNMKQIKLNRIRGTDSSGRALPGSIPPAQYGRFLISIFKRWVELDDPTIKIREIDNIINLLLGGDLRECLFAGDCFKYATVYSDGSIYACDSLPKQKEYHFGHVTDDPLKVRNSPRLQELVASRATIRRRCGLCEWYEICRGGCLQDWGFRGGVVREKNSACESLKVVFANIQKELEEHGLI